MSIRIPLALLALAISFDATARPRDEVPAATPSGTPQNCIPLAALRETRVRDDRTIDFFVGRQVYRNVLPNACPSLGFERAFSYTTSLSQLCSTDIIHVFQQSLPRMAGAACGLGQFQPVTGVK